MRKMMNGLGGHKGAGGFFGGRGQQEAPTEPQEPVTTPVETTYSDDVVAELLFLMEEEKLAGDVYEAFYDLYGIKIFDNIAASEDRHFAALEAQAEALGIDMDEFVFSEPGSFENEELQALYDSLIESGSASVTDALNVGVAIEEKDIIDLAAAAASVEGTALADVYQNLLTGSEYHLEAFNVLLG
ncbi:DUF2202 domain-containing protein [Tateyamaria pelophila]|uniref:DUF2202 domain-containing protein n=1 Tax=Tateyamaria pelophila TaxID=328415 RepID=UPI001CBFF8A7|nr:DUF2202 domain-containing protein [Tateyamaria pelophila]